MTELTLILFLVLCNGLFVAAEFSIVAVSVPLLEFQALNGSRRYQQILNIVTDPSQQDRYIATAQIGITLASLGLGMYGEEVLASWFMRGIGVFGPLPDIYAHALASVFSVSLLTYMHVVLGEMIPKSLALGFTDKTIVWLMFPMLFWMKIFSPAITILNGISNGILSLFGVSRNEARLSTHSAEELELIFDESEAEGILRRETGELIQHLFDFGELTAEEVMVPRVHVCALPLNGTAEQIAKAVTGAVHTYYPVFDGDKDHIVGVVHIKDLLGIIQNSSALDSFKVKSVSFVPSTAGLQTVLDSMAKGQEQLAVVLDEYGGTAGIVTVKDIFQEVVGEFGQVEQVGPTGELASLSVPGTARLDEIGDSLDLVLDMEDVNSVGGLVLALLERPPVVGDRVFYCGIEIEVTEVSGHGVQSCRIKRVT